MTSAPNSLGMGSVGSSMVDQDYCLSLVRDRDRDRYLSVLHATAPARPALFALYALDLELAAIIASTTEPMLGEIRLAWWREQLVKLDGGSVPAQPVLAALAEHVLPCGVTGQSLEPLEDGLLALLIEPKLDAAALARYADRRGGTLFAAAAMVLGGDAGAARELGRVWALGELVRPETKSPPLDAEALLDAATPPPAEAGRPIRSLRALTQLARHDIVVAYTGHLLAPRGSTGRQLKLAWTMLTGR